MGQVACSSGRLRTRVGVLAAPVGHSVFPLSLWNGQRNLIVTGDQVLPTISPFIGAGSMAANTSPLRDYLAYQPAIAQHVDETTLGLPGHGLPFRNVAARLQSTKAHHNRKLLRVAEACAGRPMTVWDIIKLLFPRRGEEMPLLTIADTLAHVNLLLERGVLIGTGDDGRLRLHTADAPAGS